MRRKGLDRVLDSSVIQGDKIRVKTRKGTPEEPKNVKIISKGKGERGRILSPKACK